MNSIDESLSTIAAGFSQIDKFHRKLVEKIVALGVRDEEIWAKIVSLNDENLKRLESITEDLGAHTSQLSILNSYINKLTIQQNTHASNISTLFKRMDQAETDISDLQTKTSENKENIDQLLSDTATNRGLIEGLTERAEKDEQQIKANEENISKHDERLSDAELTIYKHGKRIDELQEDVTTNASEIDRVEKITQNQKNELNDHEEHFKNVYTKDEVDDLLETISGFKYVVVESLPSVSAADKNAIYILHKTTGTDKYYEEYIVWNNAWVKIGTHSDNLASWTTRVVEEDDAHAATSGAVYRAMQEFERTIDGGRADSKYGGVRVIDCGTASR